MTEQKLDVSLRPLLLFDCPGCAPDELPVMELRRTHDSKLIAGRVEWVHDEQGVQVPFVVWVPDEPLALDNYTLFATLPDGFAEVRPLHFSVKQGPEPRSDLALRLEAGVAPFVTVPAGTLLSELCDLPADPCAATTISTRATPALFFAVSCSQSTGYADEDVGELSVVSGAFVHRMRVYAGDQLLYEGQWGDLILSRGCNHLVDLVQSEALAAEELCAEVESLRVNDGTRAVQERECIASPGPSVAASLPAIFVELSSARSRECHDRWQEAWCRDNVDCVQGSPAAFDACLTYAARCGDRSPDMDAGLGDAGRDDAGPAPTVRRTVPARSEAVLGSGGCLVAGQSGSSPASAWLLAALVLLARRTRPRGSSVSRRPRWA